MTSRANRLVLVLSVLTTLLGAQSSAALFDAPVVVGDDYTRFMNVLDFDGDGWKDALSVWYPSGTVNLVQVRGFRNDQTGRLVPVWTVTHGLNPAVLAQVDTATGDMNLDGQEDFVVSVAGTFYIYLSNGVQPPTLWVTTSAGGYSSAIRMADFNGDGRADIVAVAVGTVNVLLTQPSGQLPFPMSTQPLPSIAGGGTYSLFLAEVNGDGVMDVGVAGFSTATQLRLYPVVGGILQPPLAFFLPGEAMPMPAAGDVDGDGDQDVVVFGMSHYRILRRTGPATFNLESAVFGGPATGLADIDQDGDLDGVCCGGGGGDSPENFYSSNYEISINNGGGAFAPAFQMTGLGSTRMAGAVDLDADGDLELVAGRCVYYPDGPITKSPFTAVATTNTTRSVLDVDLDGDPDMQSTWTAIAVLRNDGAGLFAVAPLLVPAPPAGSVWVGPGWPGDWDGDGDVDLVVVQQTTGGAFMAMRLLRNNSGGGYTDGGNAAGAGVDMRVMNATPIPASLTADDSLAADIDLDGDLDLICRVSSGYYNGSRTWLNSGSGYFTAGQELPGNYVVAVAPLDANATPDFLGVYGASSTGVGPLRLCRGLGGGAIAGPDAVAIVSLAIWWNDCALADLDGDGDLDLATTTSITTYVGQNDGNGNFSPPSPAFFQTVEYQPSSPQHVAILDADADGYLDIVVGATQYTSNGATAVHRGTATPWVFQPKSVQVFTAGSFTDVDGDGDRDVLGGGKLTRNRHFRQPDCGSRRQYGIGLAGSGAMVPVIGAVGPFRAGVSGETRIRGGLSGAHALCGLGFWEIAVPILGGTLYTDPLAIFEFDLLGAPGVPGAGWINLPWTMPASLVGTAIYHQVAIIDPGAPQGASLTNGMQLTIGP